MKRIRNDMSTRRMGRNLSRKHHGGFTLIELLVVLGIAALVSAITMAGFTEMREGNKRVSCQANLTQIYQASRMYAADEGGKFPAYAPNCGTSGPTGTGIGLWALYTFPNASFDAPATPDTRPVERYLRSSKVLHCPTDNNPARSQLYNSGQFNLAYLSYQGCDDNVAFKSPDPAPNGGTAIYLPTRTTDTSHASWKRQLIHKDGSATIARPPADDTIVTWCPHHRGQRDMDNVLFYDGTVQLLPRDQAGAPSLWERIPKPPA